MSHKRYAKKKFIFTALVVIFLLGVTTTFLAQISKDNTGYRTISIVETSGRVSVVKDGIEYSAYPGMLLQEGQEVITAGNSYARMVLDDDKYIKLESGSRAILETIGLLGSGKTAINLERGSLTSELVNPLGADESYVVNTPNAVLAVRGTFFRVDLSIKNDGDVTADVMTYGGQVASQRIQPDGKVVEEEVLIDAGYKATINMTPVETHYIVETEGGETLVVELTQPITTADIPDEDLIDIYFAAENGHELFVTAEEVKTDLEEREIVVEEYTPVYEKAAEVKKEQEESLKPTGGISNTTSAVVKADDSQPIAKVEKKPVKDENISTSSIAGNSTSTGLVDGVHIHKEVTKTTEATCTTAGSIVVTCRNCKEILSEEEIPAAGHVYAESVTKEATCTTEGSISKYCERCDEINDVLTIAALGHTMMRTAYIAPDCTTSGSSTYACACGYSYTETEAALGHKYASEYTIDKEATCTNEGSKSRHCTECDATSDVTAIAAIGHTIVNTGYVAPGCTTAGSSTYACACGYSYTETVTALGHKYASEFTIDKAATCTTEGSKSRHCTQCSAVKDVTSIAVVAHTEVYAGTSDAHTKCGVCGFVLGTNHEMTTEIYEVGTCKSPTKIKASCECAFYNITMAGYGDHNYLAGKDEPANGGYTHIYEECEHCGEVINEAAILAINEVNFPDDTFREYLSSNEIDTDRDNYLSQAEIAVIEKLDLKGTGYDNVITKDGGVSDLTGIEYLKSVTTLWAGYNANLTEVDVSQNPNIEYVIVPCTGIKSLDLSNSPTVESVNVDYCEELTNLDLSNCTELGYIQAYGVAISQLDISQNPKIVSLKMGDSTELRSLITDDTGYPDCTTLYLGDTGLDSVEFSLFSNVTSISVDGSMSECDLSACDKITGIFFHGGSGLESFSYNSSTLKNIIFIDKNEIKELRLNNTAILDLDLSGCMNLETLDVSNTFLRELNLEGKSTVKNLTLDCTYMHTLDVSGTSITELDLTGCRDMNSLTVNSITTMDNINNISVPESPLITEFSMNGSSWSFDDSAMDWFANLTSFSAVGSDIADDEWLVISPKLSGDLQELDISGNTQLTNLDVAGFTSLKTLRLQSVPVQILDIRNMTQLEELDIRNSYISGIDASGTGSGLMVSTTNPATVKYFNSNGTSMAFNYLSEDQLKWLQTVEYLGIGGQNVDDLRISDTLFKIPESVKELDLSGSEWLTQVVITTLPNLEKLYVRDCIGLSSVSIVDIVGENFTIYTSGCTSLTDENIRVPENVTLDIDDSAE